MQALLYSTKSMLFELVLVPITLYCQFELTLYSLVYKNMYKCVGCYQFRTKCVNIKK